MKHRIRWMLVGLGFTFGLQSLIALLANLLFFGVPGSPPAKIVVAMVFGLMIGAFLIGGFIVGVMSERFQLTDTSALLFLTLLLSAIVFTFSSGVSGRYHLTTNWLSDASGQVSITAGSFLYVALAWMAAAAGTYIGYRVNIPQEGQFDRLAALLGLLGAVVGPFVLFSIGGDDPASAGNQGFPWYFLVIVILIVLVLIGVGFLLFTRESHHAEEISIHSSRDELATGEK